MSMLYNRILKELQIIEKKIKDIKKELPRLPEGKLHCQRNGRYWKWYVYIDSKQIYINKDNHILAEQLAYKNYLLLMLKDLENEKKALMAYLTLHKSDIGQANELLVQNPEYKKLLSKLFKPQSEELNEWMHASYEKNSKYPEQLIYKAHSGNYVRSKSETIIDLLLSTNKIPFRYENPLYLGRVVIYPDFTIRHPQTGEFFYWEHFGMMDDVKYSNNACGKLQLYIAHGIIPSVHLITTYETKEHPLTSDIVEKIIDHYFL